MLFKDKLAIAGFAGMFGGGAAAVGFEALRGMAIAESVDTASPLYETLLNSELIFAGIGGVGFLAFLIGLGAPVDADHAA